MITPTNKLENKQSPRGPAITGSRSISYKGGNGKVPETSRDNLGKPLVASSKVKPCSIDNETQEPAKGTKAKKKVYMLSSDGVAKY